MKRFGTYGLAAAALALAACGQGGSADGPINEADLERYKTQCEIAAVGSGATSEEATGLCDCTVTRLAEGRTAAEFDAMSGEEANAALEQCVRDTGLGTLPE